LLSKLSILFISSLLLFLTLLACVIAGLRGSGKGMVR